MSSGRFLLFQAICALLVGTQARPAHDLGLGSRQTISVLSQAQVAAFKPYTYYSSAGGCDPALTANWTCGKKCDATPAFQPVASGGDGAIVQYWYVGYAPDLKTVIVSHQGTDAEKVLPILTDINIIQRRLDSTLFPGLSASILVHAGFAQAQENAANDVLAAVHEALSRFNATSVTLTGHSLGAAISLLDAVFLPLHLPKSTTFKTVVYGLTRVGNQAFADYVDANVTNVTHIHNKKDFVPTLPGRFLGFHHPSGEIHIGSDSSWSSCPGQDNTDAQCTIGYVPSLFEGDINDHPGPYDGVLMGCNK